nr:hypothetical protein [Rhodothermus marinus]
MRRWMLLLVWWLAAPAAAQQILIPMDAYQTDHLKPTAWPTGR